MAARVAVLLSNAASGKAELARKLGHRTVSGELHKQSSRLHETGIVEMTIPDKPTSRLQKYRLTDKGRALLEEIEKEYNHAVG